jgi:hypothetical protein
MMKKMPKSGNRMNGRQQKPNTSKLIHSAASVEIRLRFPITKISKITENQNISIFLAQDPTVIFATAGTISADINVPSVENFVQNPKVNLAINVLRRTLIYELCNASRTETNSRINSTGKTTGSITLAKKSGTENGWKCVYPDFCMVKDDHDPPCPVNCGECLSLRKKE